MNALVGYLTENCCRAGSTCDPACRPTPARQTVAVTRTLTPTPPKRRRSAA
jgi:hypothetical protein